MHVGVEREADADVGGRHLEIVAVTRATVPHTPVTQEDMHHDDVITSCRCYALVDEVVELVRDVLQEVEAVGLRQVETREVGVALATVTVHVVEQVVQVLLDHLRQPARRHTSARGLIAFE